MAPRGRHRPGWSFRGGPRRNRSADWSRRLVRESLVTPSDLIWPLFIAPGKGVREPIAAMPGVERLSVDGIVDAAREARALGIPAIALFPNTPEDRKSVDGAESANPDNLMCQAPSRPPRTRSRKLRSSPTSPSTPTRTTAIAGSFGTA